MKRRIGSNLSFAQDQFAMREMTIYFCQSILPSGPERLRGGRCSELMGGVRHTLAGPRLGTRWPGPSLARAHLARP
jgi:hypothetical protein